MSREEKSIWTHHGRGLGISTRSNAFTVGAAVAASRHELGGSD